MFFVLPDLIASLLFAATGGITVGSGGSTCWLSTFKLSGSTLLGKAQDFNQILMTRTTLQY